MTESNPSAPANTNESGALRIVGEFAIVLALALVTFWKSLSSFFNIADYDWISLAKFGDSELEFLKKTLTSYRWFAGELFRAAYSVFGADDSFPYRVILLIIHIANALICGRLAARILQRPKAGWIAAVLFVVSPASSEAVHSISAFVYPCVTLLLLFGLLLYDQSIEKGSWMRCVGAFACFGVAAALREHWIAAFPLAILLEIARGHGFGVFKNRGPWLRLGPSVAAGVVFLIFRHVVQGQTLIPRLPEYQFNMSMVSRLVVTLEQLVLPPLPLDFSEYAALHETVGVLLIFIVVVAIAFSNRDDRWRIIALFVGLFISLAPFLPVQGDHIRQRFAYFGTAFAAGIAAYVICLLSERMSPRVTLPIVAAMLVGLLLEQQAEFEREYTFNANETRIRIDKYREAGKLVAENDDIACFATHVEPNFDAARSMMRLINGVSRKQVIQFKATSSQQLYDKFDELKKQTGAKGMLRIFYRSNDKFEDVPARELDDPIRRIFNTGDGKPLELTIVTLLPRPL
ncbi:MAG: hypothetical protein HY286_08725 [Planctomycetes bacterium]|nr:hypothetical protein [Planctomycetota bacterium]